MILDDIRQDILQLCTKEGKCEISDSEREQIAAFIYGIQISYPTFSIYDTAKGEVVYASKDQRRLVGIEGSERRGDGMAFIPNRSLDYYAQTNFLFVICLSVFRLQWYPIAPSKRRDICSKTRVVIIITLMTDLGLSGTHSCLRNHHRYIFVPMPFTKNGKRRCR